MDSLTAECFFNAIRCTLFQATQHSLAREELIELSKTLQLILTGLPGDAAGKERARAFCIAVYASGLFHRKYCREKLRLLVREAEHIGALLESAGRRNVDRGRLTPPPLCPSYTQ